MDYSGSPQERLTRAVDRSTEMTSTQKTQRANAGQRKIPPNTRSYEPSQAAVALFGYVQIGYATGKARECNGDRTYVGPSLMVRERESQSQSE